MAYENNARLTWLEEKDGIPTAEMLAGYSAAIIKLGESDKMNPLADKQLSACRANGIPGIAYYQPLFDYTHGMSFNAAAWPKPAEDVYMKILTRAMQSGGVNRAYSAVIIDISNTVQVPGSKPIHLAPSWVREFAIKHWQDMVWQTYRLPVYTFITPAAYARYKGTELSDYLKGLPAENALSTLAWSSVGDNSYPTDSNGPMKDATGILSIDSGYWHFWLYAATPRLMWLYNGSEAALYQALNYSKPTTPPPPADDDTNSDTTPQPVTVTQFVTILASAITEFCKAWLAGVGK